MKNVSAFQLVSQGVVMLIMFNHLWMGNIFQSCQCTPASKEDSDSLNVILFIIECIIVISSISALLASLFSISHCLIRHMHFFKEFVECMYWIMVIFVVLLFAISFLSQLYFSTTCECYNYAVAILVIMVLMTCVSCWTCRACCVIEEIDADEERQSRPPLCYNSPPPAYDVVTVFDREEASL
jgi:uncharacterized membrane protein